MMAPYEPRPSSHAAPARLGALTRALAVILALTLPFAMAPDGHAAASAMGAADVHVDVGDLEINVYISQTQDDCATASLNGQYCLRYSVAQNETMLTSGYGLIAPSAVKVSASSITLSVNTASYPNFNLLAGHGGSLSITWNALSGSVPKTAHGQTSTLSPCSIQGTVMGYKLTGIVQMLMQADMLIYH